MRENNRFISWIKERKTELIITGVAVVGTVLVVKNRNSIMDLFKITKSVAPDNVKIEPTVEEIVAPIISDDILNNLTGNKLTARALGDKVWCSAQAINKRIVDTGLAVKLPCGEYMMTEEGCKLGQVTWKITAAGYSFSNIEWDEKILEVIFKPKELLDIFAKQEQVRHSLD